MITDEYNAVNSYQLFSSPLCTESKTAPSNWITNNRHDAATGHADMLIRIIAIVIAIMNAIPAFWNVSVYHHHF